MHCVINLLCVFPTAIESTSLQTHDGDCSVVLPVKYLLANVLLFFPERLDGEHL